MKKIVTQVVQVDYPQKFRIDSEINLKEFYALVLKTYFKFFPANFIFLYSFHYEVGM